MSTFVIGESKSLRRDLIKASSRSSRKVRRRGWKRKKGDGEKKEPEALREILKDSINDGMPSELKRR